MLFRATPSPYRPHDPTWRQPLHLHLHPLWQALEEALGSCQGRVLDVGCGLQPYRTMLSSAVSEYVGLDREGPLSTPTVVGTVDEMPFEDGHFDVVYSTQVLEHVPSPERALAEMTRVLKPKGRLILTLPGVWPTHEAPHDYWRFTRHGILHLMKSYDVEIDRLEVLGGLWSTVGQMMNLELQRKKFLRHLVPLVNLVCARLDRKTTREDLVLNWLVDGTKT